MYEGLLFGPLETSHLDKTEDKLVDTLKRIRTDNEAESDICECSKLGANFVALHT